MSFLPSDTEGTDSTNRDQNHDAKVFALGILMSTLFIFNSVGCIDDSSISQLQLTTTISKNIAINNHVQADEQVLSYYAPKFIWLLRDFVLEMRDPRGKQLTSNQYLEMALQDEVSAFS